MKMPGMYRSAPKKLAQAVNTMRHTEDIQRLAQAAGRLHARIPGADMFRLDAKGKRK